MAMATPAIVTLVRTGRRRHSFAESSSQFMLTSLQRLRGMELACPKCRVKSGKHTCSDADPGALQQCYCAQRQQWLSRRHGKQLSHEVFKSVSRDQHEH